MRQPGPGPSGCSQPAAAALPPRAGPMLLYVHAVRMRRDPTPGTCMPPRPADPPLPAHQPSPIHAPAHLTLAVLEHVVTNSPWCVSDSSLDAPPARRGGGSRPGGPAPRVGAMTGGFLGFGPGSGARLCPSPGNDVGLGGCEAGKRLLPPACAALRGWGGGGSGRAGWAGGVGGRRAGGTRRSAHHG